MSIESVLVNVFGEYPFGDGEGANEKIHFSKFSLEDHIDQVRRWLDRKLTNFEQNNRGEAGSVEEKATNLANNEQREAQKSIPRFANGIIGAEKVVFECKSRDLDQQFNITKDKLSIQSKSPFATLKANCCVYKGKWMYEVQLRSKGVMQIGWCSASCKFTQDNGVGDTRNSYGLDGSKQRLWHVHTKKYGPYWRSGDVFGVCLDMDTGSLEYHRNGMALGKAFTNIDRGPGIALFPAMSLAFNENVTANFGGTPFRHPVAGYQPLQKVPQILLDKADFLLQNLVNLSRIISSQKAQSNSASTSNVTGPSAAAVHMILINLIITELAPILNNCYVVENKVVTYIRSMCVLRSSTDSNCVIYPGLPESTLGTFLTLLWNFLDNKNMRIFIKNIINYLSSMYRGTPVDLEYDKQRTVIVLLTCLCNHPKTRKYLLEYKFFKRNCLPIFLYIKPPDESTLADLLPDEQIWTDGLGGPHDQYMAACQKLIQFTDVLYVLQKNLVNKLLQNDDDRDADFETPSPSSRKLFLNKLRTYVMENSLEHRTIYFLQGNFTTPTQPAVALSFLCILLDCTRCLFAENHPNRAAYVQPFHFYDDSFKYNHVDRMGGILSHLKKTYRAEIVSALGEDHGSLIASSNEEQLNENGQSADMNLYSAMFLISDSLSNSNFSLVSQQGSNISLSRTQLTPKPSYIPISSGCVDCYSSLNEILDCCIMYYYAVAHKYIVMIADLRDNIGLLSNILIETRISYEDIIATIQLQQATHSDESIIEIHNEILMELNQRYGNRTNVFAQRSMELARKQAWYRSVALGQRRQNLLAWMLHSIFNTLTDASKENGLFSFVPEVYISVLPILLDTVLDFSFHDLKLQYDLSSSMDIIKLAAEFLAGHATDSRIIMATCKDAILQALGTLTCHEAGVQALEQITIESQRTLVMTLLKPYENRAWGQSNWLLTRLWLGKGFAFRDARPPCIWQGGNADNYPIELQKPQGLVRSRGKSGSHTGLLHYIAPACPSLHFHNFIREVLIADEQFSTIFINSILSQLNWAFSEFILLLQEIQRNIKRQHHILESRQLKLCSMCFELTVSLLRSLEMLMSIVPEIFKDPSRNNSDLLLSRVCQLLGQVLSRVTIPPGCFQFVIDMCLPDLSAVTSFSIISSAIGCLLTLLSDELDDDEHIALPRISKLLLSDPSFQISSLEFVLGDIRSPERLENVDIEEDKENVAPLGNFDPKMRGHIDPLTNETRVPTAFKEISYATIIQFDLRNYITHVSKEELLKLKQMIEILSKRKSLMSDVTLISDDSVCPICYSRSVSVTFEPCNHQSCKNCIAQHLLNNKLCFYCKTFVSKVETFDGLVIYQNIATSSSVEIVQNSQSTIIATIDLQTSSDTAPPSSSSPPPPPPPLPH